MKKHSNLILLIALLLFLYLLMSLYLWTAGASLGMILFAPLMVYSALAVVAIIAIIAQQIGKSNNLKGD
jgi:Ca2+/H+ antiporter